MPGSIRPRSPAALLAAIVLASTIGPAASLTPGPLSAPTARGADAGLVKRVTGIRTLSHEVFGYLPYWRLDSTTAGQLRYDLVSTIGLFGIGIKATGDLDTAWIGYKEYVGADAAAVTNAAHRAGVRVVPTFQLFDSGSLTKMKTFLGSGTAQDRFIAQAIALMKRRLADGASLDFEPMPSELTPQYLSFVDRFADAMRAAISGSRLTNATSAGAPSSLISGLADIVDHMFVMTYNYRWSGSTVAGAVAPLDNTTRTVKRHITNFLRYAPASKIIMGVPYYGYDWPVTSNKPNATVQSSRSKYGGVNSISYKGARDYLAAHPSVVWQHDDVEGSAFFSYWSSEYKTWRQVYFDDERSLAAKYNYAIATRLAGIGIWTLQNDRGYSQLWDLLKSKFYAPTRKMVVKASIIDVRARDERLTADTRVVLTNRGSIPEEGRLTVEIKDEAGTVVGRSVRTTLLYPGKGLRLVVRIRLGSAVTSLDTPLTVRASFRSDKTWQSKPATFIDTR
jgi:spore germination protein